MDNKTTIVIYYILMGKNLTDFGISILVLVLVDNLDQSLCQVRYVTRHREPNFMASLLRIGQAMTNRQTYFAITLGIVGIVGVPQLIDYHVIQSAPKVLVFLILQTEKNK